MSAIKTPLSSRRFRSLTVTLSLAFLALSLFVLFLSTLLELYITFETQQEVITNEKQMIAAAAASAVTHFTDEKLKILDQAADINDLAGSSARRELVMGKLLGRDSSYRRLFLFDTNGTELASASRLTQNQTSAILDEHLMHLTEAVKKGERYISPVYIDPKTSEPLVLIAVPAKNILRDVKGAFVAEVNLKFMWDLVSNIQVGKEGLAYVVDNDGKLIAFRDTSRVLAHEDLSRLTEVKEFLTKTSHQEDFGVAKGISGTYVSSDHAALGIPDWSVVIEIPLREAYASVFQVLWYSLLVILISSIVAVVSGTYLARRVTEPLLELNKVATEISHGKLKTNIFIKTNDEIGQLASSFGEMTSQIEQSYQTLEDKVVERTKELDAKVDELGRLNKLMIDRELKMVELKKENEALRLHIK
ncbi:MAG: cache domain-containing protein [Patescibacteria group bacterium]